MAEILDNAVWHSLHGPHRRFAVADPDGRAVRFDAEVSVFSALPDEPSPADWAALARLTEPGTTCALFGVVPDPPAGWTVARRFSCGQYLAGPGPGVPDDAVEELTGADVPEMAALVAATEPGPFRPRTIELGTYLGIRHEGRLVAMAGERLRLDGHTEISAVCTDAAHRRQGLSARLCGELLHRIGRRGHTAFLHVEDEKPGAIALYEQLGFTRRASLRVLLLTPPAA